MRTRKFAFEINWPLVFSKFLQILGLQPRVSNFFSITRTIFPTVGQNNFCNKTPNLIFGFHLKNESTDTLNSSIKPLLSIVSIQISYFIPQLKFVIPVVRQHWELKLANSERYRWIYYFCSFIPKVFPIFLKKWSTRTKMY